MPTNDPTNDRYNPPGNLSEDFQQFKFVELEMDELFWQSNQPGDNIPWRKVTETEGMNLKARYEALSMYDQRDTNGTELRALAGNFLFSTGANEFAGRTTAGHFDIPILNTTITLDVGSSSYVGVHTFVSATGLTVSDAQYNPVTGIILLNSST